MVTSQYTMWNFVFLNLFKQFQRPANVYFLLISVLQTFPAVSVTNGVPTTLMPLIGILVVAAIRDALDDRRR